MRLVTFGLVALVLTGCTKKSEQQPPAAPPQASSLNNALNFGERKAGQIEALLSESERMSCAKQPLQDIYACQVSHYMEHSTYGDSLQKMSCVPQQAGNCAANWSFSLEVLNGGNEFIAKATHKASGETWKINQAKVMEMETAGTVPAR